MVGLGFGLDMAFFLLLCPLARSPPCSCATATRCRGDRQNRSVLLRLDRLAGSELRRILERTFARRRHSVAIDPGGVKSLKTRAIRRLRTQISDTTPAAEILSAAL